MWRSPTARPMSNREPAIRRMQRTFGTVRRRSEISPPGGAGLPGPASAPPYQEVDKDRGCDGEAVDAVNEAAHAGEQGAAVLDPRIAFDGGHVEIPDEPGDRNEESGEEGGGPGSEGFGEGA